MRVTGQTTPAAHHPQPVASHPQASDAAATRNTVQADRNLDSFSGAGAVSAKIPKTGNAFIDSVSADAIKSQRQTGVPASVTMAQAILESGWGKSGLSTQAHNYFGIKGEGPAGHVTMRTREVINGQSVYVNANFRKYHNAAESFTDHGKFLRDNPRYHNAFKHTDDPQRFAQEIAKAGYATDPKYASTLNSIIKQYGLERFDKIARSDAPTPAPSTGGTDSTGGTTGTPAPKPPSGGGKVLKEGSRGAAVTALQKELKQAGVDPGKADGVFGPKTQAAVKKFQKAHNLDADGIAGPKTMKALKQATAAAPKGTKAAGGGALKLGSEGAPVKELQRKLDKLGYGAGKADGKFGPQTQSAVEEFQAVNKLNVDGVAGAKTLALLDSGKAKKAPAQAPGGGDVGTISPRARKEMNALVDIARRNVPGTVGLCYGAVSKYLDIARANGNGYGKTNFNFRTGPGQEVASQFGEWMNNPANAAKAGMRRLNITNPYDAPKGAIVVVAAGSPGTTPHQWWVDGTNGKRPHPSWAAHPNWPGDISVAGGNGTFVNDHTTEQYGGSREAWARAARAGTAHLVGIYVPAN